MKRNFKDQRKKNVPKRLARLKRLRELKVPLVIIKTEQIALVLNRDGMKFAGIGSDMSNRQAELYAKYVNPLFSI